VQLHSQARTMMFLVLLPRLLMSGVLLWLGCRWLLATPNFADLVLNAVALEFILTLKAGIVINSVFSRFRVLFPTPWLRFYFSASDLRLLLLLLLLLPVLLPILHFTIHGLRPWLVCSETLLHLKGCLGTFLKHL